MVKLFTKLFGFCVLLAASPIAAGERTDRDTYKHRKDQAGTAYHADKENCGALNGSARNVCEEQARGKKRIGNADAAADYENTRKSRTQAGVARAEAGYAVATEKCDALGDDARGACRKDARASGSKAKADARTFADDAP